MVLDFKNIKIGDYAVFSKEKGKETFLDNLKDGDIYFCIRLSKTDWFDTRLQGDAEIISRLVRIENMLKRLRPSRSRRR
jgi:hypothetical protein